MTTATEPRWSRKQLLAQLVRERYGDLDRLDLERHIHSEQTTPRHVDHEVAQARRRRALLLEADAHLVHDLTAANAARSSA